LDFQQVKSTASNSSPQQTLKSPVSMLAIDDVADFCIGENQVASVEEVEISQKPYDCVEHHLSE
jgi:hypothetical protein